MPKFHLITTGGTMDAVPYEIANTPKDITPLPQSLVPDMLRSIGETEFTYTALPPADSKDFLADGQRLHLLIYAIKQAETPVIITHGTDALGVTSVAIYEALKAVGSKQLVIFAVAMSPLSNTLQPDGSYDFSQCDGTKNMQRAIAELENLKGKSGVYIASNEGKFFEGNRDLPRVRKEFNTPTADKRYFYLTS